MTEAMLLFTTVEKVDVWVAIASGVVSLATLILAGFTASMARQTRRMAKAAEEEVAVVAEQSRSMVAQAKASEDQVRMSAAALTVGIRPMLTRDPDRECVVRYAGDDRSPSFDVFVPVRNVGAGIALFIPHACRIEGKALDGSEVVRFGRVDQAVLAPRETAVASFHVEGSDIDVETFLGRRGSNGLFVVSLAYTDFRGDPNGDDAERAEIFLAGDSDGKTWHFFSIRYWAASEPDALAEVEFDAAFTSQFEAYQH